MEGQGSTRSRLEGGKVRGGLKLLDGCFGKGIDGFLMDFHGIGEDLKGINGIEKRGGGCGRRWVCDTD